MARLPEREPPWDEDATEPDGFDLLGDEEKAFYEEDLKNRFTPVPDLGRGALRFQVMSTEELLHRPEQKWTVDGFIPEQGFTLLVGRNQVGKTFLGFDLACHISLGRRWFGRTTRPTKVLYVTLEGFDKARLVTWCANHGIDEFSDLGWLETSLNLKNKNDRDDLLAAVREFGARLVIVDTLNRSMSDFDENGSTDMGVIIEFADRLRHQANASLLVIHHTPREGSNPRGHTSLEDAADTVLYVTGATNPRRLTVTKQRRAPSGARIDFCIVQHPSGGAFVGPVGPTTDVDQLTPGENRLVQGLVQYPSVLPGTHKDLKEMAVGELEMVESTFGNALNGLVDNGILAKDGEGKGTLYEWTKAGEKLVNSL